MNRIPVLLNINSSINIVREDSENTLFDQRIFEIALFLSVFYSLMNLTPMPNNYLLVKVINELAMVLCSGYFILIWISCPLIKKFEKVSGVLVVLLASFLLIRFHYRILPEVCLLLAVRISISFDYILRRLILYGITVFLFIALCSFLGLSKDESFVRDNMEGLSDTLIAHTFGFYYYSASAYLFMNIIICKMYLCRNNCSWLKLSGFLLASILVFLFSVTRVQLVVNLLMIAVFALTYKLQILKFSSVFWKILAMISFPVATIGVCAFFSDEEMVLDDELLLADLFLNSRLSLNQYAFELYDVTPFGNLVETSTGTTLEDYFFIDCGYIDVLIRYGYVMTAFVQVVLSLAFYKIYKTNDFFLYFWMFLFVFVSFVNSFFFAVVFFPLPLLIGCFMDPAENNQISVLASNNE